MSRPEVLLSLHDVAPVHRARIARAESLFEELGVRRVAYLLVPDFHGAGRSDEDESFVRWCRAPRPFAVEWFLHGYHHREDASAALRVGRVADRLKRRWLTGGEAEFLALAPEEARRRIERGVAIVRACTGAEPEGFVAPAWLPGAGLSGLLREMGFHYHEDHRRVYHLQTGRSVAAPVITWATRTPARRWSSAHGCPLLHALWRGRPVLRLAVHPLDFEHEATIRSIRAVWSAALRERAQTACEPLFERGGSRDPR